MIFFTWIAIFTALYNIFTSNSKTWIGFNIFLLIASSASLIYSNRLKKRFEDHANREEPENEDNSLAH